MSQEWNGTIDELKKIVGDLYDTMEKLKGAGISAIQIISNLLELQGMIDFRSVILVSSVDSVNWLLNIRGNTLRHTPIFHAMLLVLSETDIIIITEERQKKDIKIDGLNILHHCFSEFPELIERLVGKKVHVDKATCPQAILECALTNMQE